MVVLRNYQVNLKQQILDSQAKGNTAIVAVLPTGGGKCLAYGTKVVLADGTLEEVQNLKEGVLLMGTDSTPRRIQATCTGSETMYEVQPVKGEPFTCNESHILSLVHTATGKIYNLSIKEYLNLPAYTKHCLKLYRTGIEMPEKEVSVDPYFFGLWLGDGTCSNANVSNIEPEVRSYCKIYAEEALGLNYSEHQDPRSKNIVIRISAKKGQRSSLTTQLKKLNVVNNKHIPANYLHTSKRIRLQVLAGLMDSDGYLHHNHYEIATVFKPLADDILYLCRSLGLAAYCSEKPNMKRQTFRITISGNVDMIPCKVERRKAAPRLQKKGCIKNRFQTKQ